MFLKTLLKFDAKSKLTNCKKSNQHRLMLDAYKTQPTLNHYCTIPRILYAQWKCKNHVLDFLKLSFYSLRKKNMLKVMSLFLLMLWQMLILNDMHIAHSIKTNEFRSEHNFFWRLEWEQIHSNFYFRTAVHLVQSNC